MSEFVFSYWEGDRYPFTELCLGSLTRVFGDRHVHLTPQSIGEWIDLPEPVAASDHFSFRCDYVRTLLLERHGGWWFDADILLVKDPSPLIEPATPAIWTLIYRVEDRWVPLINCGILFSPASSPWIKAIARDFAEVDLDTLRELTWNNEDVGQDIYEMRSLQMEGKVAIGGPHEFNSAVNVDADFAPFWDGTIDLDSAKYGMHIGASLSRWAARDGEDQAKATLESASLRELVERFPNSVACQYLRRLGQTPVGRAPQPEGGPR